MIHIFMLNFRQIYKDRHKTRQFCNQYVNKSVLYLQSVQAPGISLDAAALHTRIQASLPYSAVTSLPCLNSGGDALQLVSRASLSASCPSCPIGTLLHFRKQNQSSVRGQPQRLKCQQRWTAAGAEMAKCMGTRIAQIIKDTLVKGNMECKKY